ncbi:MAG: agmatine deiminase family protein [Methanobacteriota archaeon]|nr:MAG: agmatine deiminase family protein [Euryarchaeota archaeon]
MEDSRRDEGRGEAAVIGTPYGNGLSMPAEWAPHKGCLVSWPCNTTTFRGLMNEAESAYAAVIGSIAKFEPLHVVSDPRTTRVAEESLEGVATVLPIELDDSWIRDNGPIFTTSPKGEVAMVDFGFNGWGSKQPYLKDNDVPRALSNEFDVERYEAPMVLEGGSISVDGEGTLLTTEQCLLNSNRNPGLSRADIEQNLRDALGITKVIWLGQGHADDMTDGHVDGVACFCAPKAILIAGTKDSSDPNYESLRENRMRLETSTDSKGRSIEIIDIIQPRPRTYLGHNITPGYINHYMANAGVVAPEFGIPEDAPAIETLRSVYADREVVSVDISVIETGGGGIHCITQQIPDGEFARRKQR